MISILERAIDIFLDRAKQSRPTDIAFYLENSLNFILGIWRQLLLRHILNSSADSLNMDYDTAYDRDAEETSAGVRETVDPEKMRLGRN
jgi:hypothetical protein